MRSRHWGALAAALTLLAAIAACVGDDPDATTPPRPPDGGGPGTDATAPVPTTNGDAPTDAGATTACADADLENDQRNCGACGHDCLQGACSSRVCAPWVVLALDASAPPVGPGTDGVDVYYAVAKDVFRVRPDGGAHVQMVTGLQVTAFARGPEGQMLACGTAGTDTGVWTLPTLPGAQPMFTRPVQACTALVADGETLWVGRPRTFDQLTIGTGSQHSLSFSEALTADLDVSEDRIYWTNQNNGVLSAPKATPDAGRAPLNTDKINEASGLAVTAGYAYVTARPAGGGGLLLRLTLDGGVPSVLFTELEKPTFSQGIARSPDGTLYFAAGSKLYGYVPPP